MTALNLTKPIVSGLQLPAGKSDHIVFDKSIPGLGVRLRLGGRKTWVFQYRVGLKQRRINLGPVSAIDSTVARQKAREAHSKVVLGHDPQGERLAAKANAALTFGKIVSTYLATRGPKLKPRSLVEVDRHLTRQAKPLHPLALTKVNRANISNLLGAIERASGPVAADRLRTSLSALYAWAIQEGEATANPVTGTRKRAENLSRERVLSDHELRDIWTACGEDDHGRLVKLLMLIPCRRTEMGGIAWSEIDHGAALWTLPPARAKNHRALLTPLPPLAVSLLNAKGPIAGRGLVFGTGNDGYSGWSRSKVNLDLRIRKSRAAKGILEPLREWRLHDLRRTVATRMAELGVLPHVIEELLGHVSGHKGGVAGVYNRAIYLPEKRQALLLWEALILSVVNLSSPTVVPFRSVAAAS